ncbi:hypothetical protein [Neptunitalea chrysea]|nr:hypothetical protein [Neptunitalea chrysea]
MNHTEELLFLNATSTSTLKDFIKQQHLSKKKTEIAKQLTALKNLKAYNLISYSVQPLQIASKFLPPVS